MSCPTCGKETEGKYCSQECFYNRNLEKAECNTCGEDFEYYTTRSDGKYCSLKCAGKAKRKRIEKECEHCRDTFEVRPMNDDQKYCSPQCSTNGQKDRIEKTCPNCKSDFEVIKSRSEESKYCSKICYNSHRSLTKICEECGHKFQTPKSQNHSYCSQKCAGKARRKEDTPSSAARRIKAKREGDLTQDDIREQRQKQDGNCYYCGIELIDYSEEDGSVVEGSESIDHLTPICKGGEHTAENIVLSCFHCNSSKGEKKLENFEQINTD